MTEHNPNTFDVLAAIQGKNLPEDQVTLYFDAKALYERQLLEEQINDEPDSEKAAELEKRLAPIEERIKASGLTFHLRGIAPGGLRAIDAALRMSPKFVDADDAEIIRELSHRNIAEAIVKVTNPEGQEGANNWDAEAVSKLEDYLPLHEFGKLADKVGQLLFSTLKFEQDATSPDFS